MARRQWSALLPEKGTRLWGVVEPEGRGVRRTYRDARRGGFRDDILGRSRQRSAAYRQPVSVSAVVVALEVLTFRILRKVDEACSASISVRVLVHDRGDVFVVLTGVRQLAGDRFSDPGSHRSEQKQGCE